MNKQQILDITAWMDDFYPKIPIKIRQLSISNNYTANTFPRCCCGKPVGYDKVYRNKFNQYCSDECSKKYRQRLPKSTIDKLSDYQWLYNKRIVEKLSWESIAIELQCSVTPIKLACKKLKIPSVRHNESRSVTMGFLRNKEWLFTQHVENHNTVEQIAVLLCISPATVSRWLSFHKIIANKANSYPRKHNTNSKECQQVVDFIRSITSEQIIINDRKVLDGKEIDILIPSLSLAFEYNGVYSHIYRPNEDTESRVKGRYYHLNKTLEAAKKNIKLIHIFSDDWKYNPDIWKSIITNQLQQSTAIYARKCQFYSPTINEKINFLNSNHLQGRDHSSIAMALKSEDQIVALITFCKSRWNKDCRWELSRYCNLLYHNVVGGFSKLLNHFISLYDGPIVSYADRCFSQGNLYQKNNFCLTRINRPSYRYVNLNNSEKRLHRSGFQKNRISPGDSRTEYQIMQERGYNQIFDCGTLTYVHPNKKGP